MKTIKRLDPLSMGKVYAILMALMQLIVGILMLIGGGVISKFMPGAESMGGAAAAGGAMALVMGVITGLILGFIIGVVGGWLYNLVAKWVGGIKIVLE